MATASRPGPVTRPDTGATRVTARRLAVFHRVLGLVGDVPQAAVERPPSGTSGTAIVAGHPDDQADPAQRLARPGLVTAAATRPVPGRLLRPGVRPRGRPVLATLGPIIGRPARETSAPVTTAVPGAAAPRAVAGADKAPATDIAVGVAVRPPRPATRGRRVRAARAWAWPRAPSHTAGRRGRGRPVATVGAGPLLPVLEGRPPTVAGVEA